MKCSFGEADLDLQKKFSKLTFSKTLGLNEIILTLRDFFFTLQNHDGVYAGMIPAVPYGRYAWNRNTCMVSFYQFNCMETLGPEVNLLFRLSAQQNFVDTESIRLPTRI